VSGVDHNVRAIGVWNVASGKKVWTYPNDISFFNYPYFSRDKKTLINATAGGRVFVHNLDDGTTRDFNPTLLGNTGCLAFSADGKRLAAASHLSQIYVWDVPAEAPLHVFDMTPKYDGNGKTNHAYAVKMAFAPDDKHLLTQEVDQTVRLWAPQRGAEVQAFRAAGHVWGFTDNGKHLLWTASRLDLLHRMHNTPKQVVAGDFDYWVGCAQWASVAYAFPEVRQFRARAYVSADLKGEFPPPQRFDFLGEARGATAMPFGLSPDGSVLAEWIMRLAGNPGTGMGTYWVRSGFRLSDVATGKEIIPTQPNADDALVFFAPDSRSFVSLTRGAGEKFGLRLIETRTGRERLRISDQAANYSGAAFSRDGRWLVFINTKNAIEIFDLALGKIAATIPQTESNLRFAFSPDGSLLASGGNSGTILLWDMTALVKRDFNEPAWTADEKNALWNDLAHADPAQAFAAIMRLKRSPAAAVALIKDRLQWHVANQDIATLIDRLGSDEFASRKKAHDTIEQLGERARPALAKALKEIKSLEHKRRVEALHALLERPFTTPIGLRLLRSIEVLDALRTPDAAALLREIAADAPADEPLGREVARALERASCAK
jgi:WD40 repeat protein